MQRRMTWVCVGPCSDQTYGYWDKRETSTIKKDMRDSGQRGGGLKVLVKGEDLFSSTPRQVGFGRGKTPSFQGVETCGNTSVNRLADVFREMV